MGLNVVIDRVTTIAKRPGRALHVVGRVKRYPPVGVGSDGIGTPDLMGDVPLRAKREIVVALLCEIALFPFTAVNESNIVLREVNQRIPFRKVREYGIGMAF